MIAFYLGLVYRIMIAFYWWLVYSYDRGILLNGWLLYHVLLVDDIAVGIVSFDDCDLLISSLG